MTGLENWGAGPDFGHQSNRYPKARIDSVRAQMEPMTFILANQYGRCCSNRCRGDWAGLFEVGSRSSWHSGRLSSSESTLWSRSKP